MAGSSPLNLLDLDQSESVRRQGQNQLSTLQVMLRGWWEFCSLFELLNLCLRKIARRSHLFVKGVNVPVIGIDRRDERILVASALEPQSKAFGCSGLLGSSIVPNGDHETAVFS